MEKFGEQYRNLRQSVLTGIENIINKYGACVFYDVEDGTTWIDMAVGFPDENGAFPDVTRIGRDEKGNIVVSVIDSEYETKDIKIDELELSLGDLVSVHDAMVEFFTKENPEPRFVGR